MRRHDGGSPYGVKSNLGWERHQKKPERALGGLRVWLRWKRGPALRRAFAWKSRVQLRGRDRGIALRRANRQLLPPRSSRKL